MPGETDVSKLLKGISPILNDGEYVFSTLKDVSIINRNETICEFKEREGTTIVLEKEKADELGLNYDYIASWITLEIHSSLNAVGFTALFSTELANHHISCNVIAGYYHDHIFVAKKDADKAIKILNNLSQGQQ